MPVCYRALSRGLRRGIEERMNIELVKIALTYGGCAFMIEAILSMIYVKDQRWFCQADRVGRFLFCFLVAAVGVWL